MTHTLTSAFWRLFPLVRSHRRNAPKDTDLTDDLPQGLSDAQLRDIGLSDHQSYLYRTKDRDPRGF